MSFAKRLRVASHDVGLHLAALAMPVLSYRQWLKWHEANAAWAGILDPALIGSWREIPLELGRVPSWWRAAVHDGIIHPLGVALPFPVWARLHNRNARWAFGSVERDRDPNPVPERE